MNKFGIALGCLLGILLGHFIIVPLISGKNNTNIKFARPATVQEAYEFAYHEGYSDGYNQRKYDDAHDHFGGKRK